MKRIKTTHVGSLPRTQKVVDFIFARENRQDYDSTAFDAAMTEAASSGSEVPKATRVRPITDSGTPKVRAMPEAPSTSSSAPTITPIRPPTVVSPATQGERV